MIPVTYRNYGPGSEHTAGATPLRWYHPLAVRPTNCPIGAERQRVMGTAAARKSWICDILDKRPVVYTRVAHVSASGMARWVECFVVSNDHAVLNVTREVARLTDRAIDSRRDAIRVNGCGFSAADDVVQELSMALNCPDKYTHDGAYRLTQRDI